MSEPETLKLVYEDVVRERDRLRDARSSFTSRLGPLPAASAVAVALFGTLSKNIGSQSMFFLAALVLFAAMVVVSTIAVFLKPYRKLRQEELRKLPDNGRGFDQKAPDDWLSNMIDVERKLTGRMTIRLEWERGAFLLVQVLFVLQIVLLGSIPLSSD